MGAIALVITLAVRHVYAKTWHTDLPRMGAGARPTATTLVIDTGPRAVTRLSMRRLRPGLGYGPVCRSGDRR